MELGSTLFAVPELPSCWISPAQAVKKGAQAQDFQELVIAVDPEYG